MLNAPRSAVDRIAKLLPGCDSPTIVDLNRQGMSGDPCRMQRSRVLGHDGRDQGGGRKRHPRSTDRENDVIEKAWSSFLNCRHHDRSC
jgi:hypothetical protein